MSQSDKNWKNKIHHEIEEFMNVESLEDTVQDVKVGDKFFHGKKLFHVTEKTECEGMWRTHVHINRSNCFDIRTPIRFA